MFFFKIVIINILLLLNIQAKNLEKVSIQLDWLHQFQFAGYYIAKEKEFYKDENLNVEIKEYDFETNLLEDVLNSKTEYAIGKSSLIIDRLEDKKVVLLAAIYQNSPMVLISLKDSNIHTPHNLKNKKVMLTPDARSAASINSMLISQGIKLNEINFQKHSFKLEDLINGTTDAMGCYLSNEPYLLKKKNIEFNIHNPSEYGFEFYGGLFFTSEKELETNPVRVRKMYKATLKGWEYAFNNIEETAQLIFDKYNTQNKSLDSLIYEGKVLRRLAKVSEGLLGNIDYKKIEEIKRLYLILALSKNNPNFQLDDLIYNPKKVIYSKEIINYVKNNKVTLLSNNSYPPFTMEGQDGPIGIELDYWKLITDKLKLKHTNIELFETNKEALEKITKNKNYLKYSFSKNDSILKHTNPIAKINIGIATLNDKAYLSNNLELDYKKIAIVKYNSITKLLEENYPKIEFIKVSNLREAFKLLKKKEVYAIADKIPALSYNILKNNLNDIKISGLFDEKFELKLALHIDNKILLSLLNEAISMISEEEINKINTKYYSIIYQKSFDYSWFYKIIIPLLVIIIFIILHNRKLNSEVKKRKEIEIKLNKVANIDSLTNIYNRRKIESLFNSEIIRIKRYQRKLSIIFFDIDDFKLINDQLGHAVGDEVLIRLSTVVKNNIRSSDFFGRWGGEEFIIILPETNKEKATNVAYILKDKIFSTDFNIDRPISCSFGVSQFEDTDSADTLLTRVDDAMYYIKRNGKNGVKVV